MDLSLLITKKFKTIFNILIIIPVNHFRLFAGGTFNTSFPLQTDPCSFPSYFSPHLTDESPSLPQSTDGFDSHPDWFYSHFDRFDPNLHWSYPHFNFWFGLHSDPKCLHSNSFVAHFPLWFDTHLRLWFDLHCDSIPVVLQKIVDCNGWNPKHFINWSCWKRFFNLVRVQEWISCDWWDCRIGFDLLLGGKSRFLLSQWGFLPWSLEFNAFGCPQVKSFGSSWVQVFSFSWMKLRLQVRQSRLRILFPLHGPSRVRSYLQFMFQWDWVFCPVTRFPCKHRRGFVFEWSCGPKSSAC